MTIANAARGGPVPRAIGRRGFLVQAGRGVLGVAVLGLAGCAARDDNGPAWSRIDLAYVSACVLVRGSEAAGAVLHGGEPDLDEIRSFPSVQPRTVLHEVHDR